MNIRRSIKTTAVLLTGFTTNCAQPLEPGRRDIKSTPAGANISPSTTNKMVQGKEIALSGFPDWCSAKPQADGTTCIACERTTDSQETAALAHLCFQPRSNFDPKNHCGLSQTELGIKNLECHTAGEIARTDVSLPVDKAVSVLSTVLFSIKNALPDSYKDDAKALAIASAVAQFASDHVTSVLTNKDISQTASDLILLVNQYLVTPYPEGPDKEALKTQLVTKLEMMHTTFAGTAAFSTTKLFAGMLAVANVFPPERLGNAASVLTASGLGTLAESRKLELEPAISGWSTNNLGFSTVDELILQIKGL